MFARSVGHFMDQVVHFVDKVDEVHVMLFSWLVLLDEQNETIANIVPESSTLVQGYLAHIRWSRLGRHVRTGRGPPRCSALSRYSTPLGPYSRTSQPPRTLQ